jgi:hypothetical protein
VATSKTFSARLSVSLRPKFIIQIRKLSVREFVVVVESGSKRRLGQVGRILGGRTNEPSDSSLCAQGIFQVFSGSINSLTGLGKLKSP